MLAACGGSVSPGVTLGTSRAARDAYVTVEPFVVHPDRRKSWVAQDAGGAPRLLFVSDSGTNDIYIFTMPAMALKGRLTGFRQPQGMCADARGNIWITNTGTSQIFQYSRSGSRMNALRDPYGYPVGCAVDKSSGDLAVTDVFDFTGTGDVLVYAGASGVPERHTCPGMSDYYFDGYGPGDTLWVSGRNNYGRYELCGGSPKRLSQIQLSGGTLYFPGAVAWDNAAGTWVVFDQFCGNTTGACSYPVSSAGALGTPTDYSSSSGGQVCDLVQPVVGANGFKYVGGSDYEYCTFTSSSSDRWAYPAGGTPTNDSASTGESAPVGAAISTK